MWQLEFFSSLFCVCVYVFFASSESVIRYSSHSQPASSMSWASLKVEQQIILMTSDLHLIPFGNRFQMFIVMMAAWRVDRVRADQARKKRNTKA